MALTQTKKSRYHYGARLHRDFSVARGELIDSINHRLRVWLLFSRRGGV